MFPIAPALHQLGITHVVWLPDSAIGQWEAELEQSRAFQLIRVCREGEAWAAAAGLHIGGRRPLVMIQNTGLFESGDAMRNVLWDMKLPLYAIIGYRSYLVKDSPDTARKFTEPILSAWGLEYVLLTGDDAPRQFIEHYQACQAAGRPGVSLLPEGRP